ncbi:MAG: hypothetical protein ABJB16_06230, partial [Saprospiraceae bacterium]
RDVVDVPVVGRLMVPRVALAAANFPITGTIKGYKIVPAGLSGTKTIGAVADYTSLTGATGLFNAINTSGLSTNLIVNIIDASVSETGAVALNAYASTGCSGGPFTVMIKPNTTATLTGSVASGALIKINGASNVTIDGSNGGGTDRSLTITNTNTTAPTAVSLVSLGTGLGASSNTIKNCNISTGVSAATGYGIAVGGSTPGTSGADNDNVTVQNNNVTVATVSIYAAGTASVTSGGDDNLQITGNTVNSNSALQNQGIQVGNALNSSITGNTVSVTSSGAVQPVGISLETGFVSSTITKNFITNVLATNTGGYGGRGITVGTGTASSSLTIANNVIYGVNGSNWSAFSNSSSIGIGIGVLGGGSLTTTTGGVNVYYNSVSMTGSMGSASSSALTTALYIGSAASVLDIRDNIFSNTQVGTSTTQKNYGIYSAAANTAFTTINFNEYYASNSFNTGSAFLGFIGSDRVDLPAIVSGFGQNANSIAGDPLFNGTSNLQPNLGSPALGAANNATTGITTDVLGIVRSSGIPPTGSTIGAYENAGDFQGPTITYTPSTIFPNTPFFCNPTVSVTITDASMVNTTAGTKPRLWYKYTTVAGGTHMNANALPATNDNTTDGWKYVEYSSNVGSVYTFILDYNLLNGGLPVTGDKISYFFVAQDLAATPNVGTNAGTYTLNPTSVALSAGVFPISGTNEYIFVSLTTAQPSTATVSAGTNNVQVIRVDVPPTSCGNVTQITFNTNGTTNAADLSKARVYYTSTTTFATTTQFGSDITNPSGSLVFTGAQATSSSTSNYFWLVYDISCAAPSAGGNVADAEFTQITLGGVSTLPIGAANINPTGTRTITSLTAALATNQPSTASVVQGAISQQVLRLDVPPTSCGNITQIDFGNASTSLTDVTKARVYYTTSTTFATTTQFGSDIVSPGLTFSVTGSQTPSGSLTNYFWLVFDISCTATPANVVDASVSSVTIGATGYTPTTTNPTGTRAITALLTGDNVQNAALALLGSGGGNPYDIAGRTLQTNEPTPIINTQPVSTNGAGSSNYSWGTAAGSTYWYRLVVPTTGYGSSGNLLIRATTPTTTPSADAQVALWKFPSMVPGTCSDPADFTGGVLLAANDDAIVTGTGYWGASASTLNSVIRVRLTPGQTYYIQLDGWSSNVPAGDLIIEDLADVAGKNVPNNGFGAIHNPTGVDMRYASYEVVGDDGWTYYYHNNGTTTDIADDVVVLGLNWSTSTTYLWNGTNATGNDLMNHVRRDAKSTTAPSTTGPASGTGSDAFIVWSGRNNASATSSDLKPTAPYVTASTLHWWMMNKFWNVFPNVQPTTSVAVRFFYSDADFTSLQTTVTTGGGTLATAADMNFIKATKSVSTHYTNAEMDPGSGHAALTSGTVTDLTASHTAGVQSGINQAQFNITTFSGGGAGSTGTPYSPLVIGCSNNVTSTANTGTGTLRDIIACVASGATITFDPSIWNSTIVLTSGSILINKNITLSGPTGADVINISANGTPPVFNITSGNLQFIGNVYIKQ